MWASLSSLVAFFIVLLSQQLVIHFVHFPLNPVLNYFLGGEWFSSLFLPPIALLDAVPLYFW
jgi:hypothetical protein